MSQDNTEARNNLIARVRHDFTFKANPTAVQKKLWRNVKTDFHDFRTQISEVFDLVNQHRITADDVRGSHDGIAYPAYAVALREAERWCNTAVANDYKEGDKDGNGIVGMEYPLELSEDASYREMCCYQASSACFMLSTSIVQYVPLGRSLSLALTRLQDVRGWILDIINEEMED